MHVCMERDSGQRVVVVTGAARGIGASIAEAFQGGGDQVVGFDLVAPESPLPGVEYVRADVSDPEQVASAFSALERVDVLVNNAGIQRVGLVGQQPVEEWLAVIGTNLNGAYFCSREAVGRMPDGGSIVSVASAVAIVALPGRGAYAASKAGLLGLTRVMGVELAGRGIRVNAICPGFVRAPLVQQGIDDGSVNLDWLMERVPLSRLCEPAEVAKAARFLSSEEASFITGQAIVVDGGWTVQGINHAPEWLAWALPTADQP
ncbi:MAG: SDR family NAD(P)-dependent oxidoreductase [Gaiellaceae bacterium]